MMKIAFGHQARIGKDTACDYLSKKYGGNIYSFSSPLYQILYHAQDVCGFPHKKDTQFLQFIGNEWGRKNNPDVWVDALIKSLDFKSNCFISDLRYPNEAKKLKDNGFLLVKIIKNDRIIDRDPNHESEIALKDYDSWDFIIENNEDLEKFYEKLEEVIKKIFVFNITINNVNVDISFLKFNEEMYPHSYPTCFYIFNHKLNGEIIMYEKNYWRNILYKIRSYDLFDESHKYIKFIPFPHGFENGEIIETKLKRHSDSELLISYKNIVLKYKFKVLMLR